MTVRNHPEAALEMIEEAACLEEQLPGYGALFLATAAALRDKIAAFPSMYPQKTRGVRFCMMPVFRYVIPYHVMGDDIVILAYAHTSRKPGYWRNRLKTM